MRLRSTGIPYRSHTSETRRLDASWAAPETGQEPPAELFMWQMVIDRESQAALATDQDLLASETTPTISPALPMM